MTKIFRGPLIGNFYRSASPRGERIVGKVAWSRTIRERRAGKLDNATFITTRPLRSVDVPENQLLKWYLTELQRSISYLRGPLGSGYLPLSLFEMGKAVNSALNEPGHLELHRRVVAETGGATALRDLGALESATAQPRASFGGNDLYSRNDI